MQTGCDGMPEKGISATFLLQKKDTHDNLDKACFQKEAKKKDTQGKNIRNTVIIGRKTENKDTHGELDHYVTEKASNCNIFTKKEDQKI